jgi:glucokinase
MTSKIRLVADIGGTNARFAIARDGAYGRLLTYATADHPSLEAAIIDYLRGVPSSDRPQEAALSIAGPVEGEIIQLTNHMAWSFSREGLADSLGFDRVIALNDFSAAALSLPYLAPGDLDAIGRGSARFRAPLAILGPGTGLGMGGLIPGANGEWIPLSGEGGHATMAAIDEREDRILGSLRERFGHVSAERLLSGEGLVNLHDALARIEGLDPPKLTPAEVTQSDDRLCREAVAGFTAMLGSVAGDLALILGAVGGVYIAGGIVPRLGVRFAESDFRRRFEEKGRFRDYLAQIPTWVIKHPNPALVGLSNLA